MGRERDAVGNGVLSFTLWFQNLLTRLTKTNLQSFRISAIGFETGSWFVIVVEKLKSAEREIIVGRFCFERWDDQLNFRKANVLGRRPSACRIAPSRTVRISRTCCVDTVTREVEETVSSESRLKTAIAPAVKR